MSINNNLMIVNNNAEFLNKFEKNKNKQEKVNAFEKISSVCKSLSKYKFPAISAFYCYNYAQGYFSDLYYGKLQVEGVKNFYAVISFPLYLTDLRSIKNGKIFKGQKLAIVAKLTKVSSQTIKYIANIYENFSLLLVKISFQPLPYLNELKKVSKISGKISMSFLVLNFGCKSHEKIQGMLKDKKERTFLNGAKATLFTALTIFLFGITYNFSIATKVPGIVLNIATFSVFTIEQSESLYNSAKRKFKKVD